MYYIGIDLGTSSMKMLLADGIGKVWNTVTKEYSVFFPKEGWSEQNPQDWWIAFVEGIKELVKDIDASKVSAIGCSGQMHGLVVLDEKDSVIRPAILWNDSRAGKQVRYLNEIIGKEKISDWTGNIAFAGFTAPKILWVQENEPEKFGKIAKIMLPKDYINYCLTGIHCSDYSDASGMLLLDVKNKCWSKEMMELCDVSETQLPKLYESYEVVGELLPEIAQITGLTEKVKVIAGAGDNAAAAIGTGTVGNNKCNISLGTSGTVFISMKQFKVDSNNSLHSFVHADGNFHLLGCMLSAASCNKWFCSNILNTFDYELEQEKIDINKLGRNSVYFLPYLMGERSPINDSNARGTFIGMSLTTSRDDMIQSVLEGVAFALRDILECTKELDLSVSNSTICGGGSKSLLWKKIIANVLGITLESPKIEEGPAYGGALLAMVGCGLYKDVDSCVTELTFVKDSIIPDLKLKDLYEDRYQKFKIIYPKLKDLFLQYIF